MVQEGEVGGEKTCSVLSCFPTLSLLLVACSAADTLVIDQQAFWLMLLCYLMWINLTQGRREMVLELVSAGLLLTQEDFRGHSPFYWVYMHADLPIFRLLVQAGVPTKPYEWLATTLDLSLHPTNQHVALDAENNRNSPSDWRQDVDFSIWLRQEMATPPSLMRQCRVFIRHHLRAMYCTDVRPLLRALTLTPTLPLPPPLLHYLTLQASLAEAAHNPPNG